MNRASTLLPIRRAAGPLAVLLSLAAAPGLAQENHAAAELFVREAAGRFQAAVEIEIDEGWHLYHDDLGPEDALGVPTSVTFGGADVSWETPVFPEPEVFDQPYGKNGTPTWINGHEGFITVYARGTPAAGASPEAVTVSIEGLTCTEEFCLPYAESDLPSSGPGGEAVWRDFPEAAFAAGGGGAGSGSVAAAGDGETEAGPGSVVPGEGGAATEGALDASGDGGSTRAPVTRGVSSGGKDKSLLAFLGLAVFWGLFTLLMPCTYPMIPITISFFTKQADQKPSRQLLLSLTYGLGIVAIFILIGVVFGGVIIQFATHPVTNVVIGALFVVFALALFGWIELRPPAFLLSAAGKASMRGGLVGVFLMGATLVVTSFTCTAPFVGSLLAAGATGGLARVVLGMGVFGLTMAVPFVLLSMVPRKLAAMPRAGEWMHVLKVFMGFVELAAALKFLSNADLVWGWGLLTRELFLVLWAAIFGVAGVFLLGMIHLKGESRDGIGPGRLVAGTATLLLAAYCGYGVNHEVDEVMTAIIPNYSKPIVGSGGGIGAETGARRDHTIVRDDYDAARRLASERHRALLVNFTGHT